MLPGQIVRPEGFPKLADLVGPRDVQNELKWNAKHDEIIEISLNCFAKRATQ